MIRTVILLSIAMGVLACPSATTDGEDDYRFTPCDEVATCPTDTVCIYGLCQPLLVCESNADCARNVPNECTDCNSVANCTEVHGSERDCIAPRVCVSIGGDDDTMFCDQAGVGCEEEGNSYYCGRKENLNCLRAQDAEQGSDPVFYCGPEN